MNLTAVWISMHSTERIEQHHCIKKNKTKYGIICIIQVPEIGFSCMAQIAGNELSWSVFFTISFLLTLTFFFE